MGPAGDHDSRREHLRAGEDDGQYRVRYTKEAGVRNLERAIGAICRKVAKKIVTDKKHKYLITSRNLEKYLGKKIFREDLDSFK